MLIKYKVKARRVLGSNNNTYTPVTKTKYGIGIVSDEMFPEGNAALLAKDGYLERISKPEPDKDNLKDGKSKVGTEQLQDKPEPDKDNLKKK